MTAYNSYKNTVLADSPIRYYRLSDASKTNGSSVVDIGSGGVNGTIHGSGVSSATGLIRGDSDGADTFASSSYVSMATTGLPTGASAWTLEAWIKMSSVPGSGAQMIAAYGNDSSAHEAAILLFNGKICVGDNSNILQGPSASNNTAYHVVGLYDGTKYNLYVNNVTGGTLTATPNVTLTYAYIGCDNATPTDFFPGTIDEVAFYSVALSSTQVANHYNAGLAITKTLGVRTRLSVLSTKTVGARTLLSALRTKTVGARTVLVIPNTSTKTVGARTRLRVLSTKSVGSRARISVLSRKTVGLRARLSVLGTKTVGTRTRLRVVNTKTLGVRTRLIAGNFVTKSVGVRVRLAALSTGGFACWANGTGTATFDHFRATQYPDPALSLAPVLPRLGNTTAAWDETIPTNGSRTVKTSLDGVNWTDVTSSNGGSIPGLSGQPDPTIDYFNSNTSANYTNASKSGGIAATVTYDTANSRVTLSGGSGGLYLYTAISDNDVDLIADMDESDAGGLVWRFIDTNNYYELGAYDDSSSGGFTNQLRLYKVVSGTRSLIGSASPITWPRSTPGTSPYKRLRVTMLGTTITVSFDGTVMQTATDSAFSSGKMGLRNDGGTSRYYQLRLQPVGDYVSGTPAGDIVTSDFVYTQVSLSTTDPTVNPQIQDLTTTANSPSVANGSVISQLHDPTKPFAAFYNNEMDSLVQSSGDFYWTVMNNALTFAARSATPAPWILYSTDLLFTPHVKPTFSADLYRNRQTITNCLGTVDVADEQKIADGTATSWQMAYPLYSAPTITVGSIAKTVGVQGVDTGKDFYWQAGSTSISQDAGATAILKSSIISVTYVGQFTTNVTRDNLPEQAARQTVEGGTGIVEAIEDGKQMLVSAAETYADGLLARFANNNTVEIQVTTRRSGLQKGHVLPTFLPEHGINNAQLLITKILTSGEQLADGSVLYQFQITATNGPNLNRWATVLGL